MKKIIALCLMIVFVFVLASCGPNSKYFDLGSSTVYYYKNEPLVVNPYELFKENKYWIRDITMTQSKHPEDYFIVKAEWRKHGSNENFKEFDLTDNMIQFDNPYEEVGSKNSYDFRFHFLDKDTKNEDERINFMGTFTFTKSPANVEKKEFSLTKGTNYTLLDNVIQYNGDDTMSPVDFAASYDIVYTVTLGDTTIDVPKDGKLALDQVGAYQVNIELTSKAASADAVSGASASGEAEKMILNLDYVINVNNGTLLK